jgi:WD40 repeat protein/transcriptional regulator with XRE-family HTH domain
MDEQTDQTHAFGDLFYRYRRRAGLSRRALGEAIGYSGALIQDWEREGKYPLPQAFADSIQVFIAHEAITRYDEVETLASLAEKPDRRQEYLDILQPTWFAAPPEESVNTDTQGKPCPYRGLIAFQEADAPFFFGREIYVQQLQKAVADHAFLLIEGASGSGKSSIVFAGVIPALRKQGGWQIAACRPAQEPFSSLAFALLPHLQGEIKDELDRAAEHHLLLTSWLRGERTVAESVSAIQDKQDREQRLFLFIDQFEELYTLTPDKAGQIRFLDALLSLCQNELLAGRVTVCLTLRADFKGQALSYRPFTDALQGHTYQLGPMNSAEMEQVIRLPAQMMGVGFEAGLVDRLLEDVGDEPGNLPLLEFALEAMWQHEAGLTHAAYREIGGVDGAIGAHADKFLNRQALDKQAVRRVFMQLVQPGLGTEDTRRIAQKEEIGLENWALVQALADERLLVTGRDNDNHEIAEIAHEALIRNWLTLQAWLDRDREFRVWQERLRTIVNQWQQDDRHESYLLRGHQLAEAEGWFEERAGRLTEAEQAFIQDSMVLAEQREAERLARQRRRGRLRVGVTAVSIIFIVVTIAALIAFNQWAIAAAERAKSVAAEATARAAQIEAEALGTVEADQRLMAEAARVETEYLSHVIRSNELVAEAGLLRAEFPQQSLLLALEAVGETRRIGGSHLPGAEQSLRDTLRFMGGMPLVGHEGGVNAVAFSPDGAWLATAGNDGDVRLWSTQDPVAMPLVLSKHRGSVANLAFSPDGRWLATAGNDGTVRLWAMEDPTAVSITLRELRLNEAASLAISPDGRWLAIASDTYLTRLWSMTDPMDASITLDIYDVRSITFSPDGQWLAVIGQDRNINLWAVDDFTAAPIILSGGVDGMETAVFSPDGQWLAAAGSSSDIMLLWSIDELIKAPITLRGHESGIVSLAFSLDGQWLATAGLDNTTRLWAVDDPLTPPIILNHGEIGVTEAAFTPDRQWLATTGADNSMQLWSLAEPSAFPLKLLGHEDRVSDVAFSADGEWMATASLDGTARLWSLAEPVVEPIVWRGHEERIGKIAFSPNGEWMATAGNDNTARLWPVDDPLADPVILQGHTDRVEDVAFSPDGRWLATASLDDTARLWSMAASETAPVVLAGHENGVFAVAFSPDGQWLVTASGDKTARLWSVSDPTIPAVILRGHEGNVRDVAFSPDGQRLATASSDGTARIWSVDNPAAAPTAFRGHDFVVNAVAFSQDGQWLATAGVDRTVRLWSFNNPSDVPVVLRGHEAAVLDVAFSQDGQRLVTSGEDKTLRIWFVNDPEADPVVLRGPAGRVTAVTFSPQGEQIAAATDDGTIWFWSAKIDRLIERACDTVGRNFTLAEWAQYFPGEAYRQTCPNWPNVAQ